MQSRIWNHAIATLLSAAAGLGYLSLLPEANYAQSTSGVILFGKIRDRALEYYLDYGRANQVDRYYLEVPGQDYSVAEIVITYPDTFKGEFDPAGIDLRVGDKKVPLESAKLDAENRVISVVPKDPLAPKRPSKVVLSYVRNPEFGGLYQFDARVKSADAAPIFRYIGSWVIGID